MIFLSYNEKDRVLVKEIAETLENVYGMNKVFYDQWSMQPGDRLIGRMNDGLTSFTHFFLFASENSLKSEMVKLEWQSALLKVVNGGGNYKFITVRISNCAIPQILLNTIYINLFSYGLEVSRRQIIDVINGVNIYRKSEEPFHNIVGHIAKKENKLIVEFRAEYYLEPHSKFAVLVNNDKEDFECKILGISLPSQFFANRIFDNEIIKGTQIIGRVEPTSPGFPTIVEFCQNSQIEVKILRLMRAISSNGAESNFQEIPIFYAKV